MLVCVRRRHHLLARCVQRLTPIMALPSRHAVPLCAGCSQEGIEELVELLRHTSNEVPRWLEGMAATNSNGIAAPQIEVQ